VLALHTNVVLYRDGVPPPPPGAQALALKRSGIASQP